MTEDTAVAVIIAAKDASATIGRAIASALCEAEVAEVIVVDDGSTDGTSSAATVADDGSGRLQVVRLPENRGPSAARNRALTLARAPFVAILDSDDLLVPGRFARLFAIPDWDMAADNVVFVPEAAAVPDLDIALLPRGRDRLRDLTLTDLAAASTTRYGRQRTQLGFLKPVIRRSALEAGGLRYDERARLGEDLLLYAGLLARGARFRLTEAVGYIAVERSMSLSARHATHDLLQLLMGEEALLADLAPDHRARPAMRRRIADTRRKWALRAFLDRKRSGGPIAALWGLGRDPAIWYSVAEGLALDKATVAIRRLRPVATSREPRLLMP